MFNVKFKNPFNIIFIGLLVGLAPLGGCLDSQPETEESGQVSSIVGSLEPQPDSPPMSPADQKAEIEKWNSYVDLGNEIETTFQSAMNAYFDIFGRSPAYQLADQQQIESFMAAMLGPDRLTKLIQTAVEMSARAPQSELDQAVGEMSVHFSDLWSGLVEAHRQLKSPQVFDPAPVSEPEMVDQDMPGQDSSNQEALVSPPPLISQQLHNRIYESHQGLVITYGKFQDILGKADAVRREKDLRNMAEKGMVLRTALLKLIDTAQNLQDMLSSRSITSSTLTNLDIAEFTPLYSSFQESIDEFEKAMQDPGQLAREKLKPAALVNFTQQLMVVRASVTSLMARLQLQTGAEPFPEESPGTPEHFGRELGFLVDQYNGITN